MKRPIHKLRVPYEVVRVVRGLHPRLKKKIRASLATILAEPHTGKALKGELADLWSVRVSRFRIVYRISVHRRIEIVAIGPRERIYEETFKLIKKDQR